MTSSAAGRMKEAKIPTPRLEWEEDFNAESRSRPAPVLPCAWRCRTRHAKIARKPTGRGTQHSHSRAYLVDEKRYRVVRKVGTSISDQAAPFIARHSRSKERQPPIFRLGLKTQPASRNFLRLRQLGAHRPALLRCGDTRAHPNGHGRALEEVVEVLRQSDRHVLSVLSEH